MQAVAAFTGSDRPRFVEANKPTLPGDGEVLCKTIQLGVCGTDREILLSEKPWTPFGSDHLILGHECLGRVEEVGSGVDEFRTGDLVVPVVRRGANENSEPRVDLMPFGTYVERGIVHEHGFSVPWWLDQPQHLFRVDERIKSVAVFTEPMSVAEKAINEAVVVQRGRLGKKAWMEQPPRVLVTGMGPIGFAAVAAARCRDWPVAMWGRDSDDSFRAELAVSFGAEYLPAASNSLQPKDVESDGYDLILECTGCDEVMLQAAESLASCGVMVWVGSSRIPQPASHNVALMMRNGVLRNHVHIGTVNAAPRDFVDALSHLSQLCDTHNKQLDSLITDRVSPSDSLWHYENRRSQGIKTVLMYE